MILVLDLDDTLYDESIFVASGMSAVAAFLAPRLRLPTPEIRAELMSLLARDGRGRTFDTLLLQHGLVDASLVHKCLRVYREHEPAISLAPSAERLLDAVDGEPLYLVTDGDAGVQQRKIDALSLAGRFTGIFRTGAFGPDAAKPSLLCFRMILEVEGGAWPDLVYVGDDPSKDFVGLRSVGARTVRVLTGRHAGAVAAPDHEADIRIATLDDLLPALGDEAGAATVPPR